LIPTLKPVGHQSTNWIVRLVLIVAMVEAQLKIAKSPLRRDSASAYAPPYSASQKTAAAAPSYASGPSYAGGRVKIQVYRGPNKQGGKGGYDDGAFAPWGFYVTQPEDNKANYGR